ncbi:MAG: lipoyl(octanoyl) transferase LipB [Gammaproteobacteria bacterium]|nr:lipoyl(octanoyl) transferase LipB [Gammaproteobacteria bacterium]
MNTDTVIVRLLGKQEYSTCWQAMKKFTDTRQSETLDEIWLVEHDPIFTQGQNGKPEHVLAAGDIPVVPIDRGGQVTYHGPGQVVAYTLIDVKRKKMNVRQLVTALEKSIIQLLKRYNIEAQAKCEAPGVYVNNKKIASVGLRIRRGCSYHGLALNVDMNLEPFTRINPCGYSKLEMTQMHDFNPKIAIPKVELELIECLSVNLGYTKHTILDNGSESSHDYES